MLRPVRLPLLPLDLGPARGVEVSLVARLVRASAPLSPQLLQELERGRLLVCSGRPLSSRERSRRDRSRSSDRSRSRRVRSRSRGDLSLSLDRYRFRCDCSRRDRSRSSDRYRSCRQHSRCPACRGGHRDRSRSRDHPRLSRERSHMRSPPSSDRSLSKEGGRRARRLLSPRLLSSLRRLLQ